MVEMATGYVIGAACVGVYWAYKACNDRIVYTKQQEKNWAAVQNKVDEIVTLLERIVYRTP